MGYFLVGIVRNHNLNPVYLGLEWRYSRLKFGQEGLVMFVRQFSNPCILSSPESPSARSVLVSFLLCLLDLEVMLTKEYTFRPRGQFENEINVEWLKRNSKSGRYMQTCLLHLPFPEVDPIWDIFILVKLAYGKLTWRYNIQSKN